MSRYFLLLCLTILLFGGGPPAGAASLPQIIGEAGVTDGDTIRMPIAVLVTADATKTVKNIRIRLHGIDAPEKRQVCLTAAGAPWACGQDALKAVADIISGKKITCEIHDIDRYDRLVSVCSVTGIADINAELVRRGLAVAYQKYSMDYVDEEEIAQKKKIGIWQGSFDMPWDWRKLH